MLKKIVDTNIFIDRLNNPDALKTIFLSEGLIYLSSIVLMELRAGAHTKKSIKAVHELFSFFRRVERIIVPSAGDYERAGKIIADLQRIKGYNIKKSASITNDCLLAASAKSTGSVLYTQNRQDFLAINEVFDFRVSFT